MNWLSNGVLSVGFVAQLLGYSETCTQGSIEAFAVGARLSLLFFLGHWFISFREMKYARKSGTDAAGLGGIALGVCICVLNLATNWRLVWGVLGTGESPCFLTSDFTDYRPPRAFSGEYRIDDVMVGIGYGLLPVISLCILAIRAVFTLPARR
jgi:hypothetical protein